MTKKVLSLIACLAALSVPAAAQDAKTVIGNAARAMGSDTLNSISFYGSGANFGLGQSNNSNGQWPRTNVSDYVRSIDFTQSTSRATGVTFAAPVTGGPAAAEQRAAAPRLLQDRRRKNLRTASIASTARITPWRSSSGITSLSSKADRKPKRGPWPSSRRRRK